MTEYGRCLPQGKQCLQRPEVGRFGVKLVRTRVREARDDGMDPVTEQLRRCPP